jgi:uncharacterized membrane protein
MWLVYAILAAVIWGLNYTLDERVFKNNISPFTLLAFIGLVGGFVFLILSYFNRLKTDIQIITHNKTVLIILLSTIVAANLGTLFIALSIQAKNATLAAIIELAYPVFTIFFSWMLFKENYLNLQVVLGGILIMAGAGLIALAG